MTDRTHIERRLRRLAGMSPEKLAIMHEAQGSQLWWAKCWNCKKPVTALRKQIEDMDCPHCGVKLARRS